MNLLFKEISMLSGLEIVLERIKEYPEEWNKWASLVNDYAQHFTQEEIQAWQETVTHVQRERFNEKVLKRLAGDEAKLVATPQTVISTGGYIDPRLVYGDPMKQTQSAAAQQAMYNPYANNNR
jgi:hypothetical protein